VEAIGHPAVLENGGGASADTAGGRRGHDGVKTGRVPRPGALTVPGNGSIA
jgi:hypothetical protein